MTKQIRKRFLIFLAVMLLISLFLYMQLNWISISKEEIYINNLPQDFENFEILHLSDLHSKSFGDNNYNLVKKVNKIDPNIIVMTGDMMTNSPEDNGEVLLTLVRGLNGKYPIYYVTGEHEEGKYYEDENKYRKAGTKEAYEERLESFGVLVLNDEKVQLNHKGNSINIYGLKEKLGGSINIDSRLGKPSIEEVNILLAHTPNYFNQYADWGADLIFSGDTHGGMIRLPFIGGLLSSGGGFFPEYDGGVYQLGQSIMIVSRGLGNYPINLRVFNRPELMVTTLRSE